MGATRLTKSISAPRERVYEALLDAEAVARWKVPAGMKCEVHEFQPYEGGRLRISLTYDEQDRAGKTFAHTDTYHGRFVKLVPNQLVIEADEFETDDPALLGEMMVTIGLSDGPDGTELVALHEGLPEGLSPAENEIGWRESLTRLAALVEQPPF